MSEQPCMPQQQDSVADRPYAGDWLIAALQQAVARFQFDHNDRQRMLVACRHFRTILDQLEGATLQDRWQQFEEQLWLA